MTYPRRVTNVPFPAGGSPYSYPHTPQSQHYIEPGTLTFTKERNELGYAEYCIYKAQPRTVIGPAGPVEGMQWMLVDKIDKLPLDISPAGPDVYATFGKVLSEEEHQKRLREWERAAQRERAVQEWEHNQARMVRQEEKASAQRIKEAERRMLDEEGWQHVGMALPQHRPNAGGFDSPYTRGRSKSGGRANSFGQEELARQFAEMEMVDRYPAQTRSRRISFIEPTVASEHSTRKRRTSLPYGSNAASYDPGVPVGSPPVDEYPRYNKSPYPSEAQLALSREIPVYPRGHVREGQPGFAEDEIYEDMYDEHGRMHSGTARAEGWGNEATSFRSRSPAPQASSSSYRGHIPRSRSRSRRPAIAGGTNELPVAFSRPPSSAVPYTPFEAFPILRNLNKMWENETPPLPIVLSPHDVHHAEWDMCMKQIDKVWSMQVDLKKRDKMVARIVDYWNAYFFNPRKVELILFRGSQRRSGSHIGLHDPELSGIGDDSYSDGWESSISSDDLELNESVGWHAGYKYAKDPRMAHIMEAKRIRKEERRRERMQRRHRKGKELPYGLYLNCLEDEEPDTYSTGHSRSSYSSSAVPALF